MMRFHHLFYSDIGLGPQPLPSAINSTDFQNIPYTFDC